MSADDTRPPLRVIRGDATPEQVKPIVAVLAAAGRSEESDSGGRRRPSRWAAPAGRLRPAVPHGLGAWRGSALPH